MTVSQSHASRAADAVERERASDLRIRGFGTSTKVCWSGGREAKATLVEHGLSATGMALELELPRVDRHEPIRVTFLPQYFCEALHLDYIGRSQLGAPLMVEFTPHLLGITTRTDIRRRIAGASQELLERFTSSTELVLDDHERCSVQVVDYQSSLAIEFKLTGAPTCIVGVGESRDTIGMCVRIPRAASIPGGGIERATVAVEIPNRALNNIPADLEAFKRTVLEL